VEHLQKTNLGLGTTNIEVQGLEIQLIPRRKQIPMPMKVDDDGSLGYYSCSFMNLLSSSAGEGRAVLGCGFRLDKDKDGNVTVSKQGFSLAFLPEEMVK